GHPADVRNDAAMPQRHVGEGEARIHRIQEAILLIQMFAEAGAERSNRRNRDLGREGDRAHSGGWRDRAVVDDVDRRRGASGISEEAALLVVIYLHGIRRPVTRGEPPDLAVIAAPAHRILPGILALRVRGPAAVLE